MTTGEPDPVQWADFERLRMIHANLPIALAASVISACLLAALLDRVAPEPELLSWLLAGILVSSARYADSAQFRRAPAARSAKGWTVRLELGTAAAGVFWGMAAALFFPRADLPHQVFIIFVLAGVCAGAMTAYGAMRRCYLVFVVPVTIPLLLRLVTGGPSDLHYAMALLTALYLGLVTRTATELDRTIGNVLKVRVENLQLTEALHYQATHDALVDLVNHREFNARLTEVSQIAARTREPYALIFIDLDWFKEVNDQGGHAAGDETLRRVGRLLKEHIRATDTAGRLGGDEFAILLPGCARERAERVASKILASIQDFVLHWDEGRLFRVGASIGVAYTEGDEHGGAALLRAADSACYAAKRGGRGRIEVCRADPQCEASGRFEISSLRKTLS